MEALDDLLSDTDCEGPAAHARAFPPQGGAPGADAKSFSFTALSRGLAAASADEDGDDDELLRGGLAWGAFGASGGGLGALGSDRDGELGGEQLLLDSDPGEEQLLGGGPFRFKGLSGLAALGAELGGDEGAETAYGSLGGEPFSSKAPSGLADLGDLRGREDDDLGAFEDDLRGSPARGSPRGGGAGGSDGGLERPLDGFDGASSSSRAAPPRGNPWDVSDLGLGAHARSRDEADEQEDALGYGGPPLAWGEGDGHASDGAAELGSALGSAAACAEPSGREGQPAADSGAPALADDLGEEASPGHRLSRASSEVADDDRGAARPRSGASPATPGARPGLSEDELCAESALLAASPSSPSLLRPPAAGAPPSPPAGRQRAAAKPRAAGGARLAGTAPGAAPSGEAAPGGPSGARRPGGGASAGEQEAAGEPKAKPFLKRGSRMPRSNSSGPTQPIATSAAVRKPPLRLQPRPAPADGGAEEEDPHGAASGGLAAGGVRPQPHRRGPPAAAFAGPGAAAPRAASGARGSDWSWTISAPEVGLGALGEDAAAEPRAGPAGPRGRGGLGGSGAPRAEDEWVDLAPLDCRGDTLRLDTLEARSHPSSKLSPPLAGEAPGSQAGLYASSTEAGLQQPAPPKRGPPLPGEAWAAEASPLAGDAPTSQVVRSYWDQALGASPAAPAPPPAHGRRSPHWEGAAAHSAMYSASEQAGGGGRSPELGVERAPLLDDAEARRAEAALLEQGRAAQLEQQARRVEREAEALKRLQAQAQQSERDVQREREKLWQEVEAEKRALHEEFDAERAALRRERRRLSVGAERQRQQLLEDREAQQERQRLQEQNLQLEEEMREKEKRWQRSIDRLQRQVADLTRKNAELQEEVRRANQQAQQAQGGHAWGDAKDSKERPGRSASAASLRKRPGAGAGAGAGAAAAAPPAASSVRAAAVPGAGPSRGKSPGASSAGQPARRALSGGRYSESRLAVDSIGSFDEGLEHGAAGAASGAGLHARHAPELTGLDSADRGAGSLGPPVDSDGHADPDELQEVRKLDGRTERIFASGRREVEFANGLQKVMWPEGRTVVKFQNGDNKEIHPDGVVVYHYSATGAVQTTLPDRTELYQFSDGQFERHGPDGSKEIRFPNGTSKRIFPDGTEEVHFADGTVRRTPAGSRS